MSHREKRFSVEKLDQLTADDAEGRSTFLRLFATQTAGSDLNALEAAIRLNAYREAGDIAHRMRTALSFFELDAEVSYLETLEAEAISGGIQPAMLGRFERFKTNVIDISQQLLSELQEHEGPDNGYNDPEQTTH